MIYNLVLQSEAIIDLREAFDWYELQKPDLGFELIAEVEDVFERLCERPLNYSIINGRFRKIKVNRFPYLVIYEIEEDRIVISMIKHIKKKSEPELQ
ncbi:MAG: type II toxin-antitoxin system RelE/ParE family toxin [Bacteroidota bacterium]|nr:type II toxin-antitoxin system RelE/ParE family toxin [Bacteroidota bacterium]MDP4213103.1 type II toxin-antitoxin system RelE/ParE family toxin [Bacteroidota bacterium]MDP4251543.1 type II toxin-antitoxin system RelE/ParE family toxin [Bacteroidota bacterium]